MSLFDYFEENQGLTLTEGELEDIRNEVRREIYKHQELADTVEKLEKMLPMISSRVGIISASVIKKAADLLERIAGVQDHAEN